MTSISPSISTTSLQRDHHRPISKLRILGISLLACSIILIAGGIVLFTVLIPGLSSIISLGTGIGSCALGGILFCLGLFLILKKEAVPLVQDTFDEIVVEEGGIVEEQQVVEQQDIERKQQVETTIERLNQELSSFEGYIQSVEVGLEKMKSFPYNDEGVTENTKHKLKILTASLEGIIPELVDIRRILEEEEFHVVSMHKHFRAIGESLVNREIVARDYDLDNLKDITACYPDCPIGVRFINFFQKTITRFMNLTEAILETLGVAKIRDHGVAKEIFEKNCVLLENTVYGSLEKSYRNLGLMSAKMHLLHENSLFQWEDNKEIIEKKKQELTDMCLHTHRKVFFGLSDDNVVDITTNVQDWNLSDIISRNKLSEMENSQEWNKKLALKNQALAYTNAKINLKNQKDLKQIESSFISSWEQFRRSEYEKAKNRLEVVKGFYPDIESIPEEQTESEERSIILPLRSDVIKSAKELAGDFKSLQEDAWESLKEFVRNLRKNQSLPRMTLEKKREIDDKLRDASNFVEATSAKIETLVKCFNKINPIFEEEVSKVEVRDIRERLDVLTLELKGITSQIESIESLIAKEELPLLPVRQALEKAYIKSDSCSKLIMVAKSSFEGDMRFESIYIRWNHLVSRLQEIGIAVKQEAGRFLNLDLDILEQKCLLQESKKKLEDAGLKFIRETAVEATSDFHSLTNKWEEMLECLSPYSKLYLKYHEEERAQAEAKVHRMTEKYRAFKMALEAMKFDEEALLSQEICIEDESKQQESEKQALHLAYCKFRAAQSRLANLESEIVERSTAKKFTMKKFWPSK
ncbi:Domain of unknown function (DUF1978) [Chlamydia serpentis]|uniref:DUF1978 domain-containing protein n=1 Tax=Chlamydia serpentis TaxID=1967782 RepID=A0A2R8FAA1_9CHLA|nr:DUF1978 domain-containing protein [Chlamydia serpentis]SPN73197.1 Domain of unknown function (DUF1978) [Chlamydia serpentis]